MIEKFNKCVPVREPQEKKEFFFRELCILNVFSILKYPENIRIARKLLRKIKGITFLRIDGKYHVILPNNWQEKHKGRKDHVKSLQTHTERLLNNPRKPNRITVPNGICSQFVQNESKGKNYLIQNKRQRHDLLSAAYKRKRKKILQSTMTSEIPESKKLTEYEEKKIVELRMELTELNQTVENYEKSIITTKADSSLGEQMKNKMIEEDRDYINKQNKEIRRIENYFLQLGIITKKSLLAVKKSKKNRERLQKKTLRQMSKKATKMKITLEEYMLILEQEQLQIKEYMGIKQNRTIEIAKINEGIRKQIEKTAQSYRKKQECRKERKTKRKNKKIAEILKEIACRN